MGKRRPAAKPTQLRILHGDRGDRINDRESVPPTQEIACPEWASDGAREIWARSHPIAACGAKGCRSPVRADSASATSLTAARIYVGSPRYPTHVGGPSRLRGATGVAGG